MQVVQQPQHGVKKEALDTGPDKLVPPKESVRPLWYSTRVMQADELLRLSKNIGSGWKNVGNGLKFNWTQVARYQGWLFHKHEMISLRHSVLMLTVSVGTI